MTWQTRKSLQNNTRKIISCHKYSKRRLAVVVTAMVVRLAPRAVVVVADIVMMILVA